MTAPTTTRSEPGLYALLAALHGHRCPMSILGARLGLAARAALGPKGEGRLTGRFLHQTCALDGIQVATGCTPGNGNLVAEPRGEHCLVLRSAGGTAVTARLTSGALDQGRAYAERRAALAVLTPDSAEGVRLQAEMDALLQALETAPEADLVVLEASD